MAFNFPASPSNGDTYTANGFTYEWDGSKWIRKSPSTGAQGAQGHQGATGATGAQGATAAQGAQGATGSGGSTGAQGATGATGAQGAAGAQGSAGAQGATGSATISNNNDNRVITGGSGTNLNAESNLTFDGTRLYFTPPSNSSNHGLEIVPDSGTTASYFKVLGNNNSGAASGRNGGTIQIDANYYSSGSTVVDIKGRGVDQLSITGNGKVAIGTHSPSSQMGNYSLDIKGDNTNAYLHMGNPFPTFAGGAYPIFRIKTTDSAKSVVFESMYGGDNVLHEHMEFAGGKTAFYDGMTGAESARFNGTNFLIGATSDLGARLQVRDDVSGTNPLALASPATNSGIVIMNYSFGVGRYSALSLECCNASSVQSASIVAQSVSSGQTPDVIFTGRDSNSSNAELMRITGGNLKFPSGKGIDFSSTSNSSGTMTSELLDDYEEGTWTPTINVGTYTTFLTSRYIKIGRLVHLHGGMIFHNNTSSTRVEISNIPFTQTNSQYVGNVWLRRTSTGERNWNMILGEAGQNILGIFRDSNGNDMGGHLSYSDFQHSSKT